nr:carboxymuconolactone decarboxylase family protein [Acinetobacter sp. Marseille-Q1620]
MYRQIDISNLEQISPKIFDLSKSILFDDIWNRENLDVKTRCFSTISVLIAQGRYSQLEWHIKNALKHDIEKTQLHELLIHLVFYVGLPNVISALENISEEIEICR